MPTLPTYFHRLNLKTTGLSALTLLIMIAGTVAIWQRNHDILRDLFDYSTVINAAGKMEAGLLPYTGVRSPMQSSVYVFNHATEVIFGRDFLSLTYGGLIQSLGGGLLLRLLMRPSLGPVPATLVALAVTMAGLLQHMVFFYNPIGILCLSLVVLGLAQEPGVWPVKSWRTLVIWAALFIGGINKLNFQGATLVLGGLITLLAWTRGKISGRGFLQGVFALGLFGLALPLVFELVWTGASIFQWISNVILLPSARIAYLGEVFGLGIYLRPAHDFHHHILVPAIGGCGLVLLLATGFWLLHDTQMSRRGWIDLLVRLGLLVAGVVLGALLMITNHESVLLTSLVYPVLAAAVYLACRRPDRIVDQWMGRLVMGAMVVWSTVGAYATWHGSRVLYAPDPPPRSSYVRLHSPSRALAYFAGVRLLPSQIIELETLAAKLRTMENSDGKLSGVLFGPALEWLERAYPETIVPLSPIWYHYGTSLKDNDMTYFRKLLGHGTRRLITSINWQSWPGDVVQMLEREYRAERVGSYYIIYHPLGKDTSPKAGSAEGPPSSPKP